VVEGLTEEEEVDDAALVSVGVEVVVAAAASIAIVVLTPVAGIQKTPVAPGIFTENEG